MSKKKDDTDNGVTSLKARKPSARLVGKVASHRGLSMADLFEAPDVREFFTHLLLAEMQKETERLQGKPKP